MNNIKLAIVAILALFLSACAMGPQLAQPYQLTAPPAIEGNSGQYMSPYTSDGVLAEWVNNARNADMGSAIGGMAGAYAGQKLAENIPFIGGWLGQEIGETVGREVALEMAGGEEIIRGTSDISFNSLEELSVWMYVTHSAHPHYQDALESAMSIYPELKTVYSQALYTASGQLGY
ncbi:hypothetical protein EGC76_02185 [Pseudidiomarina gelatinasegens]|jgi:hypothetical protein|uniref:Glycine zipper 2TM domain-containing protein n=1 Tax=Pseudidiomarina gelatinasegens TaxID=2487740 RepID=A0A443Z7Z3_9GAMM|nr:hypothetical protein [Pseudidiomarina gelatinasegens]RWU13048.1 hypothetical protein EGC76_02185 [Pseudidiomarina gelatinasegens]